MARNLSRTNLVDAAKDLNQTLRLDPTINIEATVEGLTAELNQAIELIEERDVITLSANTKKVVSKLNPEKAQLFKAVPTGEPVEAEPVEAEPVEAEPVEAEPVVREAPAVEETPVSEPAMAHDEAPMVPAAAEAVGGVEGEIADSEMTPQRRRTGSKRYQGSLVEKWDNALIAGGTWKELAEGLNMKPGQLRAHAKWSEKRGFYRIILSDDKESVRCEWINEPRS